MSLLTPFDPWKSNLCSCPAKYSLSAYTGCGHDCLYCYASSYIRDFKNPRGKKDFIKRLEKEVKKLNPNSLVTIANSSDPYQPLEEKLQLTKSALEVLKNYDLRINIVTKSSLILRDIKLLKALKKVSVSMSLTTLDGTLAKKLEPGASKPKDRLKAIEKLSRYLPIIVRFDPLIYPLNTEKIKDTVTRIKSSEAKQIITSTYKIKPDNFKRMLMGFPQYKDLWEKLYLKEGKRIGNYIYLAQRLRKELISCVRNSCLKEGLYFSTCREGLKDLNTKACDGSSFILN